MNKSNIWFYALLVIILIGGSLAAYSLIFKKGKAEKAAVPTPVIEFELPTGGEIVE